MPVYFIQQGEDGPVKVGYSKHPEYRIKKLQTASPYKLKLLATIPDKGSKSGRKKEAQIKKKLKKWRLHGEWFQPSPDVMIEVEKAQQDELANSFFLFRSEERKKPRVMAIAKNALRFVDANGPCCFGTLLTEGVFQSGNFSIRSHHSGHGFLGLVDRESAGAFHVISNQLYFGDSSIIHHLIAGAPVFDSPHGRIGKHYAKDTWVPSLVMTKKSPGFKEKRVVGELRFTP